MGKGSRERRCVATGAVRPEAELIRIAFSPDGETVPDLAADLPGRGAWVSADRASVDRAAKKGGFARSAGRTVTVPPDLADRIEALLAARCLALLGLARRGGDLAAGETKVREALKQARPAFLVEASDGAADGRGKILALAHAAWGNVPLAGCFTAAELGAALGRDAVIHAALRSGGLAGKFGAELARLGGFRRLSPADWETGGG